MLDENLPAFFMKPNPDDPLRSTIYLGQGGQELSPEYTLRRPDPKQTPEARNCYAVALYDSHNPDVLYGEVLVQPEWTQPTLSQAEIRANNGLTPPPVPVVPNSFTIQLYNPDQQVAVKQIAGSWNSSAYWEFEMPQQTFRLPSASSLDRAQSDPAASIVTPKVTFKWKKDGKLSRDITCFMAGKSTNGKKSKEPDITIAMFRKGKEMTMYEPNMHRVDVEDTKGLEVVILLGATVIRDIYFEASKEMFNISAVAAPTAAPTARKSSVPVMSGARQPAGSAPPPALGAYSLPPPISNVQAPARTQAAPLSSNPPMNPLDQWQIDNETARLRAQIESEERERDRRSRDEQKERDRRDREEQKRIKKMLDAEAKEQARRDAEVARETERLRRQYGVDPVRDDGAARPSVHFAPPLPARPVSYIQGPAMPPRPQGYGPTSGQQGRQNLYNQAQPMQQLPQHFSAPHSQPTPVQRPVSANAAQTGLFSSQTLNNWWSGPNAPAAAPTKNRRSTSGTSHPQAHGSTSGNNPEPASTSFAAMIWGRGLLSGGYSRVSNGLSGRHHTLFTRWHINALGALSALFLIAVVYCHQTFYRDPGSFFFDPIEGYRPFYSVVRQSQVNEFLIAEATSPSPPRGSNGTDATHKPTLCIGMSSVKRPEDQYVQLAVGSLVRDLTPEERNSIHFAVLFAHTTPSDHPLFNSPWLSGLLDAPLSYNVSESQLAHLKELENERKFNEKLMFDFLYLIDHCRQTGATWIAMVEDDVLAQDGWYHHTLRGLEEVKQKHDESKTWVYLRLFYTEKFLGWNSEEWPTHLAWSIFFVTIPALLALAIRNRAPSARKNLTNSFIATICLIFVPACIVLYFLAGRVSMQPLPPGVSLMNNYGCCAQGLVFSQDIMPSLVARLESVPPGPADVAVETWAIEKDFERWALTPSVIQHIGRKTMKQVFGEPDKPSERYSIGAARGLWNFGFELHDSEALKFEHMKVSGQLG
ncbi:hypothetical protein V500_02568 [Pseudogymnoascus sp. VKM F-4518 (FW-2643)]|nr:hypothetical protein V500_02568 [Pseudogymnoascus sp. VKM F-4518 (FW-2643)]